MERLLQDAFPQPKFDVQLKDVVAVLQRSFVRPRELGRIDKFQADAVAQDAPDAPADKKRVNRVVVKTIAWLDLRQWKPGLRVPRLLAVGERDPKAKPTA